MRFPPKHATSPHFNASPLFNNTNFAVPHLTQNTVGKKISTSQLLLLTKPRVRFMEK